MVIQCSLTACCFRLWRKTYRQTAAQHVAQSVAVSHNRQAAVRRWRCLAADAALIGLAGEAAASDYLQRLNRSMSLCCAKWRIWAADKVWVAVACDGASIARMAAAWKQLRSAHIAIHRSDLTRIARMTATVLKLRCMRLMRIIRLWRDRAARGSRQRLLVGVAVRRMARQRLVRVFNSWRSSAAGMAQSAAALRLALMRMLQSHKTRALSAWRASALQALGYKAALNRAVTWMVNSKLAVAFSCWLAKTNQMLHSQACMRRGCLMLIHRNVAAAHSKWMALAQQWRADEQWRRLLRRGFLEKAWALWWVNASMRAELKLHAGWGTAQAELMMSRRGLSYWRNPRGFRFRKFARVVFGVLDRWSGSWYNAHAAHALRMWCHLIKLKHSCS